MNYQDLLWLILYAVNTLYIHDYVLIALAPIYFLCIFSHFSLFLSSSTLKKIPLGFCCGLFIILGFQGKLLNKQSWIYRKIKVFKRRKTYQLFLEARLFDQFSWIQTVYCSNYKEYNWCTFFSNSELLPYSFLFA